MPRVPIIGPSGSFLDYPGKDYCMSFFFTGCPFRCEGCQNPGLQIFGETSTTKLFNPIEFLHFLRTMEKRHLTKKIVFMGGDPLYEKNLPFVKDFLNLSSEFEVTIYTGFSIEKVRSFDLKNFEFIKSGLYEKDKAVISEKNDVFFQLASTNQKVFNSNFKLVSKRGRYYYA